MKRVLVFLLFMVLPVIGMATTIHVPGDQPTIQAGIDAAVDGDTVLVSPGTYVENIDFLGKAITVQSEQGPEVTIIDGGSPLDPNYGSVVTFVSSEGLDSVLNGFTLTNGTGTYYPTLGFLGGGILCDQSSSPTIIHNIITGNTAVTGGGGIGCTNDSSPLILNNTITNNIAEWGGGILCFVNASPGIYGNTITGNNATAGGGGFFCQLGCFSVISGNTIANNDATGNGGGIASYEDSSPHICGNIIDGNTAVLAGGIYCNEVSPMIAGNSIINNTASEHGGGIRSEDSTPIILNNLVKGNSGLTGGGISIYFETIGSLPEGIVGNIISDNIAVNGGGGMALSQTTTQVLNNLITGNKASTLYGGGVNVNYDSDVLIANNTITGNSAGVLSGGGVAVIYEASATLENNIIWGNSAPIGNEISLHHTSSASIGFCDVNGGEAGVNVEAGSTLNWGVGNIDEDPLFVIGSDGDYYLSQVDAGQAEDSPCLDAGSEPAADVCFEGAEGTVCLDQRMTRTDALVDIGQVDMGFHFDYRMVEAALTSSPASSTVPFMTQMTVSFSNRHPGQTRTLAGRINVDLAGGGNYSNWRAGYTDVAAGGSYISSWNQNIPALGSLIGENEFTLLAEDVTPAPFNQPPYPPAGDTATATCTVTGIAP